MGLRAQAALDCQSILEDESAFGHPITVTNPAGVTLDMIGNSKDIGVQTDPDTGGLLAGRTASVTLSLLTLNTAGFNIPRTIASRTSKPWLVTFLNLHGTSVTFKISASFPDNTLDFVLCNLTRYSA